MSHLLDVNFLVALFDARHPNHQAAHRWFGATGAADWATCTITEAGCVRVLSNPAYPTVLTSPREALRRLARFCDSGGHRFWPDDRSLPASLGDEIAGRLQGHHQLTDFHLAALADRRQGRLVTFDGRLRRALDGTRLAAAVRLIE